MGVVFLVAILVCGSHLTKCVFEDGNSVIGKQSEPGIDTDSGVMQLRKCDPRITIFKPYSLSIPYSLRLYGPVAGLTSFRHVNCFMVSAVQVCIGVSGIIPRTVRKLTLLKGLQGCHELFT